MTDKERNNKLLELKQMIKEYWVCDGVTWDEIIKLKDELEMGVEEFNKLFTFYQNTNDNVKDDTLYFKDIIKENIKNFVEVMHNNIDEGTELTLSVDDMLHLMPKIKALLNMC